MGVEIYINSRKIDVTDEIEIIRQVMDIFDISTRVVDYSKTIKVPKTAKNKEIMEGLGFVDSKFPFKINYADVYSEGIILMRNAFVVAKETDAENYTLNFISGSKEIWKVIDNDNLSDLDLSDTDHIKSSTTIKTQWEEGITDDTKFHYIYADFGGKLPESGKVFGNYIVPSYRASYLLSKIEEKYNVQFNLSDNIDIENIFLNFSDANEVENTNDVVVFEQGYSDPILLEQVSKFQIETPGIYYLDIQGYFIKIYPFTSPFLYIFFGQNIYPFNVNTTTLPITGFPTADKSMNQYELFQMSSTSGKIKFAGNIRIVRRAVNISGNIAFKDFKITDFLKEIIYQSASIPIKRRNENIYDFITFSDIISNDAEDWSAYFDSVENEEYIIGKYAQNNFLRYKYEEKEDSNKDGIISVNNKNLDINSNLLTSKMYNTPINPTFSTIGGTEISTQQYQLWRRISEQVNGVFEERYEPLSGRMFFLSGKEITTTSNFTISTNGSDVTTNKITVAVNDDFNFQRVVNLKYKEIGKILQNPKIVNALFKIPLLIFANFDFKRRIYIRQLSGYFIINKMPYKSGELMKLELINANISPEPNGGIIPIVFSAFFKSNNSSRKQISAIDGSAIVEKIIILNIDYTLIFDLLIDGVSYPFTKVDNEFTFNYIVGTDLLFGIHNIKIITGLLEVNLRFVINDSTVVIPPEFEQLNPLDPQIIP